MEGKKSMLLGTRWGKHKVMGHEGECGVYKGGARGHRHARDRDGELAGKGKKGNTVWEGKGEGDREGET